MAAKFAQTACFQPAPSARKPVPPFSTCSRLRTGAPQYHYISGVEALGQYAPGGFYPVRLGDLIHGRYQVVDKLGHGGYSTVWLARDSLCHRYVALKICAADSESCRNEVSVIQILTSRSLAASSERGQQYISPILDAFQVTGPNGTHPCYATSPARCDLRQATQKGLLPLDVARAFCGKLALALAYVHSRGYVHGDVHLANVHVRLPSSFDHLSIAQFVQEYGKPETVTITRRDGQTTIPPNAPEEVVLAVDLGIHPRDYTISDAQLLLSDFGESFFASGQPGQIRLGKECHNPLPWRPPEAHLEPEAPLSFAADIWSLGMAFWELVSMKSLCSEDFASADDIIAQLIDLLGPLPMPWRERWAEQEAVFFDEEGRRRNKGLLLWPSIEMAFEEGIQEWREKHGVGFFDEEEKAAFLSMISTMLKFCPEERPPVQGVLESEWMMRWAMPNVRQSAGKI